MNEPIKNIKNTNCLEGFKNWIFLLEMREEVSGWLSPKGKLYRCHSQFCHATLALKNPEIKIYLSEDSLKRYLDEKIVDIIYDDLWRAGFLRVVASLSSSQDLYFEGTADAIRNLYHKARDLAEGLGTKAVFQTAVFQTSFDQ